MMLLIKARDWKDGGTPDMFGGASKHVEKHTRKDGVVQGYHVASIKPTAAAQPAVNAEPGVDDPDEDEDHPAPIPRRSIAHLSPQDRAKWLKLHRAQHSIHYHEMGKVRADMDRVRSMRNKAETAMRESEAGLKSQRAAPFQEPARESRFAAAVGANRADFDKHARKLSELASHHENYSRVRDALGKEKDAMVAGSGDLRMNLMSGQRSTLAEDLQAQKDYGKQYRDFYKKRGKAKKP